MTKDFKKQSASTSALGQYGMGWMVGGVAIGLLIGAGMFALAKKGNAPDASTTPPAVVSAVNAGNAANPQALNNGTASLQDAPTTKTTNKTAEETPGFSYHAVLPQLEINVPLSAQAEQQAAAVQQPPLDKAATDKKKEAALPPPKEADKKTAADTAKPAEKAADKKPAPQPASVVPNGLNGFQIGSYKTQDQAAEMLNRLKQHGLNARIEQAHVQGATWFRVKIGPASSPDMMHKWQQTLSGMGISPMAVRM